MAHDLKPGIREWIQDKDILITGGSGFMGKILIEKLLRCCSVGKIYILLRDKKGLTSLERWNDIKNDPVWDRLKREKPDALNKVVVINGDVLSKGLAISEEDKKTLEDNVSIVFHTAATVRFDDPLSSAILLNTRGTNELITLAKSMKKLECFQHVSTTYCNANRKDGLIEEKVYDQEQDWKTLVEIADREEVYFNVMINKVLLDHPNTYTLSKSLAEIVVKEASEDIPAVIFRPSVEPVPGWMDNFNGPIGVTCAVCKGVLRAFRANPKSYLDFVAVDFAINGMIITAWHRAQTISVKDIQVYNCAYADEVTLTFEEMVQYGVDVNHDKPMDNNIWYPFLILTNNSFYYHFLFYFLQLIPAVTLDLILLALNKKPLLIKLNTKIYLAAQALSSFTLKTFKFDNKKYRAVWELIPKDEENIFSVYIEGVNARDCMFFYQDGAKKFLLHEKESDLDALKVKHWRLYYIDRATKAVLIGVAAWYLLGVLQYITSLVF